MRLTDLDRLVTAERVRLLAWGFLVAFTAGGLIWLLSFRDGLDPLGKPLGYDFLAFFGASELVLAGRAAAAYDMEAIAAVQRTAVAGNRAILPWLYPPTFLLVVAPLGLLGYGAALAAWVAATLTGFLAMVRRLSDHRMALPLALGFSAVFANAMQGQIGFLTAALAGFGLLLLDRRPLLAGLILGLLVIKPHFGLLLPVMLLADRRWPAIAGAALSSVGLCLASLAAFGPDAWTGFLASSQAAAGWMNEGYFPAEKSPSVLLALKTLGAPNLAAVAVYATLALALGVAVWRVWRADGDIRLKIAVAVPAMVLASPYAFDYDLVLLAIPIGLLADHARRAALAPGTKAVLALAYVAPALGPALAKTTGVQLTGLAVLLLFAAAWRTWALGRAATDAASADAFAPVA